MEELHRANLERNKAMDAKIRALYSAASGAINDFLEVVRGYGKVVMALDLRQQGIIRRSGSFIKVTSVVTPTKSKQLKAGAKPVPSSAVSMASQAKKKSRSRGKGRTTHGQSSHPLPPPYQPPKPATNPAQPKWTKSSSLART